MRVRKATAKDWKSIQSILKQTNFPEDDIQDVKDILLQGEGCFVISDENVIIGTVSGHWHGKKPNIEQIAVLPSHQGKGMGTLLLNTILDYFRNMGESKVYAKGVNKDAVPFYRKHGFRGRGSALMKDLTAGAQDGA